MTMHEQKTVENTATDPVISAGRLCIEKRLSGCLDGDRFVSTTAAVSALGAVTVPPIPEDKEIMYHIIKGYISHRRIE